MKKYFLPLALLLTVPAFAAENPHYISVRGEGEIKVKPDLVTVSLTVHTKAKDGKLAQAKNAKEMARVMAVLKDNFKVDAKDIQTTSFQVNPEYNYQQQKRVFLGYVVDHSLSFTYRKLDRVGEVLDKLVTGGQGEDSVQLVGLTFDSDKRKELEVQALELAMKNASARAEALARFAKKPVKGVLRISDSSVSYQPFRGNVPMAAMAKMEREDQAGPTHVSAGEITVTSGVAVDYEIE
jgi:uncharacterized protein YggE